MDVGATIHMNGLALGPVDTQSVVFRTILDMFQEFVDTSWLRGKQNCVVCVKNCIESHPWNPLDVLYTSLLPVLYSV